MFAWLESITTAGSGSGGGGDYRGITGGVTGCDEDIGYSGPALFMLFKADKLHSTQTRTHAHTHNSWFINYLGQKFLLNFP